jgi:hypothetical protein
MSDDFLSKLRSFGLTDEQIEQVLEVVYREAADRCDKFAQLISCKASEARFSEREGFAWAEDAALRLALQFRTLSRKTKPFDP